MSRRGRWSCPRFPNSWDVIGQGPTIAMAGFDGVELHSASGYLPKVSQKTWRPCPPKRILRLVERSANRLIMDEKDLLEVVMESLRRFKVSLVGTNNPQVAGLWNYQGGGNRRTEFAPKDEEDLSGSIAAWLQNDLGPTKGIILNREVQPRRGGEGTVIRLGQFHCSCAARVESFAPYRTQWS
jgi:hypothetical protein